MGGGKGREEGAVVSGFQFEVSGMGRGGEGEVDVGGAAEGFEEEGDAGEGFGGGEVLGLEGGLFGEEEGAGDRELGPGVEDFGGLEGFVRAGLG